MKRTLSTKRPIRENLLRQLALAKDYLKGLYELEADGCSCGYQITSTEREIEKLTKLTH
jgi:hypothetical protein